MCHNTDSANLHEWRLFPISFPRRFPVVFSTSLRKVFPKDLLSIMSKQSLMLAELGKVTLSESQVKCKISAYLSSTQQEQANKP